MRASADVPLCVEAVIADSPDGNPLKNGWSTRTSRLERGEKRWGYDVTSARGWMEHLEQECGAGAYTVLRCDAIYDGNECSWRVWGLEFHLDRLCSSYGFLADWEECSFEEEAKAQTNNIVTTLLQEAELAIRDNAEASTDGSATQDVKGEELARTLMLTVLWTPPATGNVDSAEKTAKPTIRGHAAFIGSASPATNGTEDAMPASIAACLGIPIDPTPEEQALLPQRYLNDGRGTPGAKVSSWCRERRPLEDPSRFKPPGSGVGEVLLVRQCKAPTDNENDGDFLDSLEILEGLTSNLFVIYKDGTVRTAPAEKVLSGYARQLVMNELSGHQTLTLDDVNAPTVEDARNGLWSEAFITSSIRLIVPVSRVVIPPVRKMDSGTLWQSESNSFQLTHSLWTAVRERGYQEAERR